MEKGVSDLNSCGGLLAPSFWGHRDRAIYWDEPRTNRLCSTDGRNSPATVPAQTPTVPQRVGPTSMNPWRTRDVS